MQILEADENDAKALTIITKESKAYWGYTEELLKSWEGDLTISEEYMLENKVYKLIFEYKIIGYYSYFNIEEGTVKLDNLFVLSKYIGEGFGKILIEDFLNKIRESKIEKIILDADPYVEDFYKKFGFNTIGQLETSVKDRFLPIMELRLKV